MDAAITAFSGKYRWLSNFWYPRVSLEGAIYPTVENTFQAAKTLDLGARLPLQSCQPGEAKRLGRTVPLHADWDETKLDVMRALLEQKFAAGSKLAAQLVATGNALLIEGNTWGDRYWGVCRGVGANHLGRLLMEVRASLT